MVSDVTLTGAAHQAQQTQQQAIGLAQDFTEFLTLLTVQLQNQDPLNPMDSSEFTNQLVQFSQVEQAINTNAKLDDLLALELGGISSVALGYVGMDASYRSADMHFDGETPVKVNYALTEDAYTAEMQVFDEEGILVYSEEVSRNVGGNEVFWDGSHKGGGVVEEGTYTVKINAYNTSDEKIDVTTVVSGRVRGIESQNGVIFLLIGERAVALGNVINATEPPEENTDEAATDVTDPTAPVTEGAA